ncbi:hypothetical protein AKJ09_00399 [Labilithrix luteola]|uniref:Uncharacterized protein n=1 Tax=Labilithrix luteola TaxID=1391654 RepID=A0A0K1PJP2_9BACT|nr:hypothetical protein AKJ09_00399 [Labilithrix luteola]
MLLLVIGPVIGATSACEDPPKPTKITVVPDAAPPTPPAREGCARTGSMDALDGDPTCVVPRPPEDTMRAVLKNLSLTMTVEPEVIAGSATRITVTITNTAPVETTVLLEAKPRSWSPRPDWTRVSGIPEAIATGESTPRLLFPSSTTDSFDRDVDAVPLVANTIDKNATSSVLAVHLRPGGKLTHDMQWFAYRIPAPAPIVKDDAGHRYVPKTSAQNLPAGEYSVNVDLPLYGLSKEERKLTTRIRVVPATLPDGGTRHR